MPKFYFEDFSPGWTAEYGPRRVTREEMIGFAAQYDPQPMHLDEEAARKTMLGGLGASGWHTCAILMKIIADNLLLDAASMGAPGIDEVKWRKPVRPGDEITAEVEVLESRVDKPIRKLRTTITNQTGEVVLDGTALVWTEAL